MNKILLGCLCLAVVSLAKSAAPTPALVKRAAGYATKELPEVSIIHAEDGIDEAEAFAIAEWQILGRIDFNRIPVQGYDRPTRDGLSWRIDVWVETQDGLINRPIFVDSDTGESHGEGWDNIAGTAVDLGASSYRIWRRPDGLRIELALKRRTVSGDLAAREECRRDAVRAVEKTMRGFPSRFEEVPLAAIMISEAICSDVHPDRQWMASFSLIEKQPNPESRVPR